MADSFNFQPVVSDPKKYVPLRVSNAEQVPFFFGGSEVPVALKLNPDKIQGQGVGKHVLKRRPTQLLEVKVATHKLPIFK
jgi:hypothetical protein